jgi:hypothetical protein
VNRHANDNSWHTLHGTWRLAPTVLVALFLGIAALVALMSWAPRNATILDRSGVRRRRRRMHSKRERLYRDRGKDHH